LPQGGRANPLAAIEQGERATFFEPSGKPVKGFKTWIAGKLEPAGRLIVDAGAVGALHVWQVAAAGWRQVRRGNFSRGDTVAILDPDGREIARGLVAYDAADAIRIAG
jgi:glutamate 5-kinase